MCQSKRNNLKGSREAHVYKPSPRDATSVAMRIGAFPERNSERKNIYIPVYACVVVCHKTTFENLDLSPSLTVSLKS